MKDLKAVSDVAPNIPESETRYVDWTDLFFGTGVNQNYQLSVANGTEKLQYFVSGGYSDEQGIVEKHISIGIISVQTWIVSRPNG